MLKNPIFLFVLAVGIFALFLPSYSKLQDLKFKNAQYAQEIEYLKDKNIELAEEKRRLIEDPVLLEKVAREKMGLIKEGEVIYKITPVKQED